MATIGWARAALPSLSRNMAGFTLVETGGNARADTEAPERPAWRSFCQPTPIYPNIQAGRGWDCNRGFVVNHVACVQVNVPENGYLIDRGDNWECLRGYVRDRHSCTAIVAPANAFLSRSGIGGWQCERGFAATGGACATVTVPENAYLNSRGDDWSVRIR